MKEPLPQHWTAAEVQTRIEAQFPPEQHANARRELARIMLDPASLQSRVQLAVLVRAGNSMPKLREAVNVALEDFREAIANAYGKQ